MTSDAGDRMLSKSICLLILTIAAAALPARADTLRDLKAQCVRMTMFWEYYGATRTEHSDGTRNWQYFNACTDCKTGDEKRINRGVEAMKDLLRRKKFAVDGALTAPPFSATPCQSLPSVERR
jgi:hypothetical protein